MQKANVKHVQIAKFTDIKLQFNFPTSTARQSVICLNIELKQIRQQSYLSKG